MRHRSSGAATHPRGGRSTRVTSPTPRRPSPSSSEMLKLSLALVITLTSDAPRKKSTPGRRPTSARRRRPPRGEQRALLHARAVTRASWPSSEFEDLRPIVVRAAAPFRRAFTRFQWAGAGHLVVGSTLAEVSQWGATDEFGQSNTGGRARGGSRRRRPARAHVGVRARRSTAASVTRAGRCRGRTSSSTPTAVCCICCWPSSGGPSRASLSVRVHARKPR